MQAETESKQRSLKYCLAWQGNRHCGSLIISHSEATCSTHRQRFLRALKSDQRSVPEGHKAWSKAEQWFAQAYSNLLAVVRKNNEWERFHQASEHGTWYEEFCGANESEPFWYEDTRAACREARKLLKA